MLSKDDIFSEQKISAIELPGLDERPKRFGQLSWRKARCLFVVSSGRVGSMMVIKLLSLSEEVAAFHEPEPRLFEETKLAHAELEQRQRHYRKLFVESRAGTLTHHQRLGKVYAEATNTNFVFLAPIIADVLPNARFLFLHRHPGEYVRSGMRRGWYFDHYWDPWIIDPQPGHPDHTAWARWDQFRRICWKWNAITTFLADFADSVGPQRVTTMSFEELVDPASDAVARIFDAADVTPPDEELVQRLLAIRVNAQTTRDFPKYASWDASQKGILQEMCGATAARLGYAL